MFYGKYFLVLGTPPVTFPELNLLFDKSPGPVQLPCAWPPRFACTCMLLGLPNSLSLLQSCRLLAACCPMVRQLAVTVPLAVQPLLCTEQLADSSRCSLTDAPASL